MAAPTPLSAFTDGSEQTVYAIQWLAGSFTTLAPLIGVGLLAYAERHTLRRWYTSRRLHRQAKRSGRTFHDAQTRSGR